MWSWRLGSTRTPKAAKAEANEAERLSEDDVFMALVSTSCCTVLCIFFALCWLVGTLLGVHH